MDGLPLLARRAAAATVLIASAASASGANAQRPADDDSAFVHWARARAIPIRSVDIEGSLTDLRPLSSIIGAARVVAFGEPTHGAHEPLAFRNRLFRYLVEELGLTAIALETGLPESQRLADFVAGGPGAPPPEDAARVTGRGMTWGFGNFAENAELARWIREYNAGPGRRRPVRLYGFDLSLGGPTGSTPTSAALDAALAFLARVDSSAATRARSRLASYLGRLPGDGSRPFTAAERSELTAAIEELVAQLERRRAVYVAASSEHDFAWARRAAEVARQGDVLLGMLTPPAPGGIP